MYYLVKVLSKRAALPWKIAAVFDGQINKPATYQSFYPENYSDRRSLIRLYPRPVSETSQQIGGRPSMKNCCFLFRRVCRFLFYLLALCGAYEIDDPNYFGRKLRDVVSAAPPVFTLDFRRRFKSPESKASTGCQQLWFIEIIESGGHRRLPQNMAADHPAPSRWMGHFAETQEHASPQHRLGPS